MVDATLAKYGILAYQSPTGASLFVQNGQTVGFIDAIAAAGVRGPVNAHSADILASQYSKQDVFLDFWEIEYNPAGTAAKSAATGSARPYLSGGYVATIKAYNANAIGGRLVSTVTSWMNNLASGPSVQNVTSLGDFNTGGGGGQTIINVSTGTGLSVPLPGALPGSLALLTGLMVVRRVRRRA